MQHVLQNIAIYIFLFESLILLLVDQYTGRPNYFFGIMRNLLLILFFTVTIASNATVYLTDTLKYTDFTVANSGWTTTTVGTPVTATRTLQIPSLTYITSSLQYIYSGCGLTLNNYYKGATGATFTSYKPINGGSSVSAPVYLSFLYKVLAQGGSNAQIIGMTNSGTAASGIHIWNKGTSATTFQLGITRYSTSSTSIQWYATVLDATQTYLVVVKWDGTKASLFVNSVLDSASEPTASAFDDGSVNGVTTSITTLSHLILRANASNNVYYYLGGIRVCSSWVESVTSKSYVPPVSSALPAPTVGTASNIGTNGFTAGWASVNNAIGYTVKVYWGTTFVDSTSVSGQSTSSVAVSKLVPGLTYTYCVLAQGDGSNYTNSVLSIASAPFALLPAVIPTNNKLKVILKLDDLGVNATAGFAPSPVYDFLKANNIKANMGAIANRFDNTATSILAPYLNATNLVGDTLFEVWNHGYDHTYNSTTGIYEFSGATYADQKSHFDLATQTIKNLLGIQMHSFGTPYNQSDATTNTVIGEDPNYKVMMFSQVVSTTNGVDYISNRVNMESATGNPVYNYFVANYNTYKNTYTDYMILQGHPNYYTLGSSTLDQFKLVVQFLISEGVEFVRCFDYYRSLSLNAPSNLSANAISSNQINLSWTANSTTENNFKIERSSDGINFTLIGASPQKSTSFSDTSVPSTGTYYYRIYADCGMKSDYSNVIQISNLGTSTQNTSNNSNFKITLNQTKNELKISGNTDKREIIQCDLFNCSCQLIQNIFTGNISSGDIDITGNIAGLTSGVYFCRVKSNSISENRKILIK